MLDISNTALCSTVAHSTIFLVVTVDHLARHGKNGPHSAPVTHSVITGSCARCIAIRERMHARGAHLHIVDCQCRCFIGDVTMSVVQRQQLVRAVAATRRPIPIHSSRLSSRLPVQSTRFVTVS